MEKIKSFINKYWMTIIPFFGSFIYCYIEGLKELAKNKLTILSKDPKVYRITTKYIISLAVGVFACIFILGIYFSFINYIPAFKDVHALVTVLVVIITLILMNIACILFCELAFKKDENKSNKTNNINKKK